MSDELSIGGAVANGTAGTAAFTFYAGPVGIRQCDGWREVAFFAPPVKARLPAEGVLDGERVIVTAVHTRNLNPAEPTRARDTSPRAIIATVIPSPAS